MIMKVMRPHDRRKRAVPASASLPILAVANQLGGLDLPDPAREAPGLRDALERVVDPVGLEYAV